MEPIVATSYGKVRGSVQEGVARFLGVPYAAAPFGANRFGRPVAPEPWDGVRDALSHGPTAPKPEYRAVFATLLDDPVIPGEECLNLNVWAPEDGARLPVMVWIHGGAFRNGSGAVPHYDGTNFARHGVVCVTINYRLGVEGFVQLPGAPANRGLLDQIAALEWVRDNIAAFGGDPGNVTVFGESAGGMSVTTLLSMNLGLFHKAITQSGAGQVVQTAEDALLVTNELAARLGVPPTAEGFAELPPEKILPVQMALSDEFAARPDPARWGESTVRANLPYVPVVDGEVLREHPVDAIAAGASRGVPLLTGTTTEEYRFFLVPTGLAQEITADGLGRALARRGIDPAIAEVYQRNRPEATPGDVLCAIITDSFFRIPTYRVAELRGQESTYMYEFAWKTPVMNLGACHALEVGFVFGNLRPGGLAGDDQPRALSAAMQRAWVDFATSGDPGWAPYDLASRLVMVFDGDGGKVVHDPRADERLLWDNARSAAPSKPVA
ncbi:MAG TPA: carboxylesterase/lipase family protein [Streptosporangiaceae bacterium]|nr:carboxylesterase/lipase family protein [Streptosporangiaceae bacterium]